MIGGSQRQLLKRVQVLWWRSTRTFFGSFVSSPFDKVLQLAFVLSVELGVEDFGDLFGFTVDIDRKRRWLDVVGDGVRS